MKTLLLTFKEGIFSELQFAFQEGSGCIEASFTTLETINYALKRSSKMFSCFLDVRKAFDTFWIDALMYKLFSDLGVNGKLWLAIKDLYTDSWILYIYIERKALYVMVMAKENK